MEKEFIPYVQALALKELGFDEPCIACYTQNAYGSTPNQKVQYWINPIDANDDFVFISAPLYQQAFRWFREKYGYHYEIFVDDDKTFGFLISYFLQIGRADKPIQRKYNTYEKAEFECLNKLIEIVK